MRQQGPKYYLSDGDSWCLSIPVGQDWCDGKMTLCSSILLAWERRMRLKKSSSGTVGPLVGGGGGAHLWSSSLDPCARETTRIQQPNNSTSPHAFVLPTWHLISISKKSSSGSLLSAEAISLLRTSWLWRWSSRSPGRLPTLARCSSSRRFCELASRSRKRAGCADASAADSEVAEKEENVRRLRHCLISPVWLR